MIAPLALLVLSGPEGLQAVAARNATAFRAAILRRDAAWFDRTLAPDFVQRTESARLDRRTALAQIQNGLLKMPAKTLTAKVASVKPEGKGYDATVVWRGTAPATLMNRPATLTVGWRDEQRWVPVKGRWLLRSLTTSRFEQSIE